MALYLDGTSQYLTLAQGGIYRTRPFSVCGVITNDGGYDGTSGNLFAIIAEGRPVESNGWLVGLNDNTGLGGPTLKFYSASNAMLADHTTAAPATPGAAIFFCVVLRDVGASTSLDFYQYVYATSTLTHSTATGKPDSNPTAPGGTDNSTVGAVLFSGSPVYLGQLSLEWLAVFSGDLSESGASNPAAIWSMIAAPPYGMVDSNCKLFLHFLKTSVTTTRDMSASNFTATSVGGPGYGNGGVPYGYGGAPGTVIVRRPAAGGTTFTQTNTGAVTPTGALIRQTSKFPAGSITPTGLAVKQDQKKVVGSITPTGTVVKQAAKVLVGSITPTGTMAAIRSFLRTVVGSVTPTGSLVKQDQKRLTGSVTPTGTVAKQDQRRMVGSITPTGVVYKTTSKVWSGSITPTGTLVSIKAVVRTFSGSVTPTGALTRVTLKVVVGSITPTGVVRKVTSKVFTGILVPTGLLQKLVSKIFRGTITPTGSLATNWSGPSSNNNLQPYLVVTIWRRDA